ncbi:unnamed protein product [Urochloa humidicola]
MERIRLSSPIFRFQTTTPPNCCTIDCFPLSSSKVAMADQTGRMFLCDAETRHVVPMPNLHKPKSEPISLFVPSADADDHPSGGGSLYVMERAPNPEKCDSAHPSDQFEAFIPCKPSCRTCGDLWHCRLLPAPPFVRDPALWFTYPWPAVITSYTVIGCHICISTECNATTYCFDTQSNTWEVVKGMLPFYGKVEYVPELKLWFGLSSKTNNLAAADLFTMDSRPQLIGDWEEFYPPEEWLEYDDSQIVNLGSGRFCITRFFKIMSMDDDGRTNRIVVFTGVEVARVVHNGNCSSGNEKVELQMKKHKSRYHVCNAINIRDVF